MGLLTTFYEENKLLAIAAGAAAVLIVLVLLFLFYRLLFGRRLRTGGNGRVRQPRLGIVDAYDLDRQRQLVLVRRDNVEHLIMIGGPTDVVIESSIVRAQQQPIRDKEAGAAIGPMPTPMVLPASPPAPALAATAPAPGLVAPLQTRSDPPLNAPRPVSDRPTPDRPAPRPASAFEGRGEPSLARVTAQNEPAAAPTGGPPGASGPVSTPEPTPGSGSLTTRPPLPPRVPPRQPLPPRPTPGAGLPPRPARPLPARAEPPLRADPAARPMRDGSPSPSVAGQDPAGPRPVAAPRTGPGPGSEPEPRNPNPPSVQTGTDAGSRRVEPPPLSADPSASASAGRTDTLESLEEEMAKLLGRPLPRRDG